MSCILLQILVSIKNFYQCLVQSVDKQIIKHAMHTSKIRFVDGKHFCKNVSEELKLTGPYLDSLIFQIINKVLLSEASLSSFSFSFLTPSHKQSFTFTAVQCSLITNSVIFKEVVRNYLGHFYRTKKIGCNRSKKAHREPVKVV